MAKVAPRDKNRGYTVTVTAGTRSAPTENDAGEFSRFGRLLDKLVQVPKSEVDEQRKKS